MNPLDATATTIRNDIAAGRLSAVEACRAALDRIATVNAPICRHGSFLRLQRRRFKEYPLPLAPEFFKSLHNQQQQNNKFPRM